MTIWSLGSFWGSGATTTMAMPIKMARSAGFNQGFILPVIITGFFCQTASAFYDVIRGPILPALATTLGLEYTEASYFLIAGQFASTLAALTLVFAVQRFGGRRIVQVACLLGCAVGALGPLVHGLPTLLLLGGLMGATVSSLGSIATILIVEGSPSVHHARTLAALHSMYGVGSMAAAAAAGISKAAPDKWSQLLWVPLPLFISLALYLQWRWPKALVAADSQPPPRPAWLSPMQMAVILGIAIYVVGEVTASTWMVTFLVRGQGYSVAEAAPYLAGFFAVLTVSRLLCAALIKPGWEVPVLLLSLVLPALALALALGSGSGVALSAAGLLGPFYPLMIAYIRRCFPARWQSMTLLTIFTMNIAIAGGNLVVGRLADVHGIWVAYCLPPGLLLLALVYLLFVFRRLAITNGP